jgi:Camelysin metallo-endopeptidase
MSVSPERRATGRKVLASAVAVLAAVGAAGLGTFGTFTDSTSTETTIRTGIVSLDLGAPGGIKTIPATTEGFLPGDSLTRPFNLENNGDTALSSISLTTTAAAPSALVSDQINGLQLALKRCSVRWTQGGTEEAPTYTCGGVERLLSSGPAISTQTLSDSPSLTPGRDDHLAFSISLPATAGNDLQTQSATLSLVFTAVQRPGTAR